MIKSQNHCFMQSPLSGNKTTQYINMILAKRPRSDTQYIKKIIKAKFLVFIYSKYLFRSKQCNSKHHLKLNEYLNFVE